MSVHVYEPLDWQKGVGYRVNQERCRQAVHETGRGVGFHQCERTGTVEEDGMLWCRQHAPSAQKKKGEECQAKWEAEQSAQKRGRMRDAAYRAIAATAIKYFHQEASHDDLERAVALYEKLAEAAQ